VTYSDNRYGDVFAEVYDAWYHDLDDVDACVATIADLADDARVLELGVGTGRIAIPLARSLRVVGIDNSAAMLEVLLAKCPSTATLTATLGHMVRDMPQGPFAVVLAAYNTLFNLLDAAEQQACLTVAASRLALGGHVIVDCFVPQLPMPAVSTGTPLVRGDARVESTVRVDPNTQVMNGEFVETYPTGRIVRREWAIRYASPAEIDAMAAEAGLVCEQRWSSYARDPFDEHSMRHISVYGRAPRASA
jgi:SAM-dependent methyltransferase